ncbi:GntR family transcriptional regulator [Listeria sp. PSOL-1]|uniref:GntR family transcriptional regulator n=1 Tax=Listeria sp. PSOL-1 TaxID=1844999 RepID=UPI0013D24A47|nr:GntR family transcriptional regulator [Listeria sp. PSOL-1]
MKKNVILYQEIAKEIKKKILSGVYVIGEYIPSETELEKMFEVSKVTIRQAVALLVSEGYLRKQRGKGTMVVSNQLFNKLSKAKSFSTIMKESGYTITKEILEIKLVQPAENALISQFFDEPIMMIKRMYLLNRKPYILYEHYLRGVHQVVDKNLNLDNISLYQLLKENQQVVVSFDDTFEVAELKESEKNLLQAETNHCLKRIRKSYNSQSELIEFSIGLYNTQDFPYKIEYEI